MIFRFFVFRSYSLPKSIQQIQANIVSFVRGVVSAIEELHAMGRAHLDIRRDNVCYDSNNQVKLIDLDRSCSINKNPSFLEFEYGNSVMYDFPKHFHSVENVDWHQLGIMICHAINNIDGKKYHITEPMANHPFLDKLFNDGEDWYFMHEVCINLYLIKTRSP